MHSDAVTDFRLGSKNFPYGLKGVLLAVAIVVVAFFAAASAASANVNPSASFSLPNSTKAGDHSDMNLTINYGYPTYSGVNTESVKNLVVDLPAGMLGNPLAVPEADRCTVDYTASGTKDYSKCPASSKIGNIAVQANIPLILFGVPVTVDGTFYELKNRPSASPEVPAYLGLHIAAPAGLDAVGLGINLTLKIEVRTTTDYGLRISVLENIPNSLVAPISISQMAMTFLKNAPNGSHFLTNPTRCDNWTTTVYANSYGTNTNANTTINGKTYAAANSNSITPDCSTIAPFAPAVTFATDSTKAGDPTGVSVNVTNNFTEPIPTFPSYFKSSTVQMPSGFELNPALGKDLGPVGCTDAQFNKANPDVPNTCPAGAAIGTVTATVPVLTTPLTGNIYLGSPLDNSDNRYRMFIAAQGAISAKLEGRVFVADDGDISVKLGDPNVGGYLPQFPFATFNLTFKGGPRAVVSNPLTCGTHTGSISLTPWSGQPTVTRTLTSTTSYDGAGAPCPSTDPFDPTFSVTPTTTAAGGHPNFTFTFTRPDRNQQVKDIDISLPTGLVAAPGAAPTCSTADAAAGTCPANTAVGSVITDIGSGPETLELPGTIYNTVPTGTEPAKLTIVVHELVGPYDLGNVVIPLDTAIRSDYGIDVTSGEIPSRLQGIPVRLRSVAVTLNGTAANGPFVYAPSSCKAQNIAATIHSTTGTDAARNASFTTTGCSALAFSPTLALTTTDTTAGNATGINATINLPSSPPQSTIKSAQVNLPAGFKINPAAADGLATCSDAQRDAYNCPAASQLGTASATSPLITAPLTGGLYAQASGTAADGSDRFPLALILKGTINLAIKGRAVVNETTGDVSVVFDSLPDLAITQFKLSTNAGAKALITNPSTCGAKTVTSTITPTSGGAAASPTASVTVANCAAGGTPPFAPTFGLDLSTTQSGAHPVANFSITRPQGNQELKSASVSLPTGFVGSLAAVPLCSIADATAGNCAAASKVGTLSASVGSGSSLLTLPGSVFLTAGQGNDIGGIALNIPAKAGPYDLGVVNIVGRVVLRPDLGLDVIFDNIPQQLVGVPIPVRALTLSLNGGVNNGKGSYFLYNATSCAAAQINASFGSYSSGTATATAPYQATGCASRTFNPSLSVSSSPNSSDSTGNQPNYAISVKSPTDSATISGVHVLLPTSVNVNIQALGDLCSQADWTANTCGAASVRGTVTINTPLLPYPVSGTAFLVAGAPGNVLPRLGLSIGPPINLQLIGINKYVNSVQLDSTFSGIPDLAFSDLTINFAGGPKGLLTRIGDKCGTALADFSSNSGQSASSSSDLNGNCLSASLASKCKVPSVSSSGKSGRSSSKATFSLKYRLASGCPAIKTVKITLPKGSKINKRQAKKYLTGKFGSQKLRYKNFKLSGRVITLTKLTKKNALSLTLTGKHGAVRLPVCTASARACAKKKLSFATVVGRYDGQTVKLTYKPAASKRTFR